MCNCAVNWCDKLCFCIYIVIRGFKRILYDYYNMIHAALTHITWIAKCFGRPGTVVAAWHLGAVDEAFLAPVVNLMTVGNGVSVPIHVADDIAVPELR